MQQPPLQDSNNPSGQLYQPSPYPQPERPSELPQQSAQTPPYYNPAIPGSPWPPQQGYPQQQGYLPQQEYPPQRYPQQQQGYPPQQGYPQQQVYQPAAPSSVQMTAVNVNVNAQQGANGCVRAIYFVFIGWWVGFWCLEIGFLLCMLIVTLPLGLMILNRLPQIMTLKPSTKTVQTNVNVTSAMAVGGVTNAVNVNVSVTGVQQRPLLLRAIYYIFVGWWVGYLWASLAYFFCLTILGLPLGIMMLNQLPVVLTLRKI